MDEDYDYSDEEIEMPESEKAPKEPELPEAVAKGGRCESKDIYYAVVPGSSPEKFHLVDERPLESESAADKANTKKEREAYAVNVFRRYNEQAREWQIYQIKINNTRIQPALETVLEGYPGLTQYELGTFSAPFHPFFHRWTDFTSYIDKETDRETLEVLQLLYNVLSQELAESLRRAEQVKATGHVAYADVALVFNPGELAFRSEDGLRAAGVIRSCRYGILNTACGPRPAFIVGVDVVDWDGRRCGLSAQEWHIFKYEGLRALTALDVSPMKDHHEQMEIRASLIERGRIFEKLRGQVFMAYTNEHEERVNDRTIIDARAYHKHGPRSFPNYANLGEIGRLTWAQSMNRYSSNPHDTTLAPMDVDLKPLTDDQCLLAVPTVKCFSIENKTWAQLDLTKFHEIPWSERAFESLVLDAEEKDLLLALVDREDLNKDKPFDDFISGKGQGMIMLLCGPPGVGKTLTAESVAEHLRRPLYKVGASDLGISARSVETCLNTALKLCTHWSAVLLIDEADVFMEARTSNNIQRNELVSVFLRQLEYFGGIMILTTNRIRSIDSAFESRIDITLTYNALTEADRVQVWKNFLAKFDAADLDIDESGVAELATWDFNGRQIKSAIKTARILAAKKKMPLNVRHLNVVMNLRKKALGMMGGEAA
ncbi:P-loop containing nucleoside triphosphate hydrolase protein [Massariosphaeria phaeospora]|uniref:P-loop containing nucleoside triphosphate hydrolase protein n=1 Tax=Massariosphaeria phaeospora TaxID=100035 RepID=A0A7C8I2H4_9PLEO|nr:P-loop containing nucleoside triphosphate hydrolase protein [Massariosphaeria phaeospora]